MLPVASLSAVTLVTADGVSNARCKLLVAARRAVLDLSFFTLYPMHTALCAVLFEPWILFGH